MKSYKIRNVNSRNIILVLLICIYLPVKSQPDSGNPSSQFLYTDFSTGIVKMKSGTNQSIALNYNTVSEKMVYEKNGDLYDMTNPELIDTVFLQDSKFVPVGNVYHLVLLTTPISLFVQYKGELLPPGTPAGYGGTSQVSNTKYMSSVQLSTGYYNLKLPSDYIVKVDPVYWIRKDSAMFSFVNERQFLKIFQGTESELKQFIKQNKIKFNQIPDLVKLIEHCNESLKKL